MSTEQDDFLEEISLEDLQVGGNIEHEILADLAKNHEVVVEVGQKLGDFTEVLLKNTPGRVYSSVFQRGEDEFEDETSSGKLKVFEGDPATVTDTFCYKPDMVFVNCNEVADVKFFISFWLHKLRKGGVICGSSYNNPTIAAAVQEAIPGAETVNGSTIWLAHKNF